MLVMRILGMCFQMGRNQPGFAIASIRLHLIFKQTGEQTKILSENGGFDLRFGVNRWLEEATKTHQFSRESHFGRAGHASGVF